MKDDLPQFPDSSDIDPEGFSVLASVSQTDAWATLVIHQALTPAQKAQLRTLLVGFTVDWDKEPNREVFQVKFKGEAA